MILSDTEVVTRLSSPLNLINRLNSPKSNPMELFIPRESHRNDGSSAAVLSDDSVKSILESIKEVEEGSLEELIPDNAAKIKLGIVKAQALNVLHDSILELGRRLPEVEKPEKLATIARDMKNIIEDDDKTKAGNTNIVVYKPITNEITKYDTIVVGE